MEKRQSLTLLLELLWWAVTAILVGLVLYPIHKAMYVWPFERWNVVFMVVLITFARYIFLLPHTFVARLQEVKIVLILLMFPLTFILISGLSEFMTYIEEHTWDPITGHLPPSQKRSIEQYLWTEMIFFGVGSIISAPLFAVRLFQSVWRLRNRGTV
ncbi:MAG TPA: hypothetical protein PK971_12470 [Saprospiraceae bacterium]|nr:hypothetical protein [Saprospiraceae bacterium]HNG90379.1 hypothetical protein [Saprospiraceae bacterium]